MDPFADPNAPPTGDPTTTDFFSGGCPPCRFESIGDSHYGTILQFDEAQQRDIKSGTPKFWPDGNPAKVLIVTLQTTERDPEIEDDDGQRKLYVNLPGGMFSAIKSALGKNKFAVGAMLAVKYTGNGKPRQAGFNAPKEYAAKYTPSGVSAAPHIPPAPIAPPAWSWPQVVAEGVRVGMTEDSIKAALKAAGLTSYVPSRDTARVVALLAAQESETAIPF